MILQKIKQIGETISENYSPILKELETPSPYLSNNIIKYIKEKYINTPFTQGYIKIKIKLNGFLSRIHQFGNLIDSNFEKLELLKAFLDKKGKFKPESRKELFIKILEICDSSLLEELSQKYVNLEQFEYSIENHDDIRLLIGNQTGTKIYFSPVMFSEISSKGMKEMPLWKINLEIKGDPLKNFFDLIPGVKNYSQIASLTGKNIIQTFISDIFLQIINDFISTLTLKKKVRYYFVFCFQIEDSEPYRLPYQQDELVQYYQSKISSEGNIGLCQICGRPDVSIIDGPKNEIGFYTDDQIGFLLVSLKNEYKICQECNSYLISGLNFIQHYLQFFIMKRGTDKNPLLSYFIPYCDDINDLQDILELVKKSKKSKDRLENIKEQSQIIGNIEEQEELSGSTGMDDGMDFFTIESNKKFSILVIIFYHPEGQSKSFHNILDIIYLDYENVKKIAKAYKELKEKNRNLKLKFLDSVFGRSKAETYICNLLNLKKINLNLLYKDVYQNNVKQIIHDVSKPDEMHLSQYASSNLVSYIIMAKDLGLL